MSRGAGNWVLVTGASSGIGWSLAICAARDGWKVIVQGRDLARLQSLCDAIAAMGGTAHAIRMDLAEPGAGTLLWREALAIAGGRIDMLVNNAGLGRHGDLGTTAEGTALEAEAIAVNVVAATELLQAAVTAMRVQGAGRVLNTASTAAFLPGPNMAVYHATKAYLLHLSEAVAEELSGTGITVTALCPGATQTAFFDRAGTGETWLMRLFPMPGPDSVAEKGWRGAMAGRRIVITGIENKLVAWSIRFIPRRLVTWLVAFFLTRSK